VRQEPPVFCDRPCGQESITYCPKIPPSVRRSPRQTIWILLLLVVLASGGVLLWGLGAGRLVDWDEGFYAEVAREILETGDWITLRWNDQKFFDQPPLLMWLTALTFQLNGVSEFSARLPSALAGVGVVLLTFLIARRVGDPATGVVAAVVLLTSRHFVVQARQGMIDVLLTFWICLAVYAYLLVQEGHPRFWLVVGIAGGLAVLTKSAAGLAAPAALLASITVERRIRTTFRSRAFWMALGLAALVILPWHVMAYMRNGEEFAARYL